MPFVGYPAVDPAELSQRVGPTTFYRGNSYFRAHRVIVKTVTFDPVSLRLYGKVRGSQLTPYESMAWLIQVATVAGAAPSWELGSSFCTCPVRTSCKHVVALLLQANAMIKGQEPSSSRSQDNQWRWALDALITEDNPGKPASVPVAVQFQVERLEPGPPGAWDYYSRPRVSLRLVQPSPRGGWVGYQDLRWQGLVGGETPPTMTDQQADWCTSLALMATDLYPTRQWVDLTSWTHPLVFDLLAQAAKVGIELLARQGDDRVFLTNQLEVGLSAVRAKGGLKLDLWVEPEDQPGFRPALLSPLGKIGGVAVHATAHGYDIWLGPLARPAQLDEGMRVMPVLVPAKAEDTFWQQTYPGLSRAMPLLSHGPDIQPPAVPVPTLVATVKAGQGFAVELAWHWEYVSAVGTLGFELDDAGPTSSPVDHPGSASTEPLPEVPTGLRDPVAERCLTQAASQVLAQVDGLPTAPTATPVTVTGLPLSHFLTGTMDQLAEIEHLRLDQVGGLPELQVTEAPPVVGLEVSAADDADWFDLGVTVSFDGQVVPFKDLFTALAAGQERLVLDSGLLVYLHHPELDKLRRLIEEAARLSDKSGRPRLNRYQANLFSELEELATNVAVPEQWADKLAAMRALQDAAPAPLEPPAALTATLRPYQHHAFEWLVFLWRHHLGGVLADDMGLGKTVEALALMAQARQEAPDLPPFLVVAPSSVVANWASEADRFTPSLRVHLADHTEAKADAELADLHGEADLIITSYAVFRLDNVAFAALDWAGLILDEAQFAKNHATKTNQHARALVTPFKLAVTGTPMENSLKELWAVFNIVTPGLLGNSRQFKEAYGDPAADPVTAGETLARLRRRLRPLMMRRTKEAVAPELPPRQEQVLHVELENRHRLVYDTHLQRERSRVLGLLDDYQANRFAVFRSLTTLRRLALDASLVDPSAGKVPSSKLDVLMEQLQDVIGSNHRALIFSQFTGYLALIAKRLEANGVAYAYLDGSTTNRPKVIDGFKQGSAPVFLLSLKAGGFGLNLTEADYVFIMDPWWNPATEAQAIDRTHRIGQDRPVMVFRLVSQATIEDKVMALKARKAALFDAVLDDDGTFSDQLSAADVRALLE